VLISLSTNELSIVDSPYDFSAMHEALQKYVDDEVLPGAAAVVLKNNRVVDFKLWGYADLVNKTPIRENTIYRIYSNTKIVTSVAAMMCYEQGCFDLDDPLEAYLPELAGLDVLKPDATDISQTETLQSKPTIRQLTCHNAGFTYGRLLLNGPLDKEYVRRGVLAPESTLEEMISILGELPLSYQPGARWKYSVSTDVLARLVEIWSGMSFETFLNERIFEPLEMVDTGFSVREGDEDRLATLYAPVNLMEPLKGGLTPTQDALLGGEMRSRTFTSGGGGLVSTIGDYTRFIRVLIGGGEFNDVRLIKPDTLALMHTNQLPAGVHVQLAAWPMPDAVFGIGFALKTEPKEGEPDTALGEFHWGGVAGTHSWISPKADLAGIIFTQRLPGFWHQFSHDFKRLVYQAAA
jgi:CubicO group peptidase (beta-lactamase class C family)